jgi:hypothetical protein
MLWSRSVNISDGSGFVILNYGSVSGRPRRNRHYRSYLDVFVAVEKKLVGIKFF